MLQETSNLISDQNVPIEGPVTRAQSKKKLMEDNKLIVLTSSKGQMHNLENTLNSDHPEAMNPLIFKCVYNLLVSMGAVH